MKRLGGFVFALLLLLTIAPWGDCAAAEIRSGIYGENIRWKFDSRIGTLTISGYGDMFQYSNEEKYPWYPYRDHIRHLVVENGVTGIGSYAFRGYEKLETVSLFYYGLEMIGEGAFQGCTSLTIVRLPRSVEYIRREAFRDCTSLERITLPPLLWKIESRAFYGCEKLSDVEIPNDFVQIDSSVFSRCPVPASVRQYVFLRNYGAVIPLTALLIASLAVLAAGILLYRAKGSRKMLLGRVMGVCIWTLLALTVVFSIDKMGLLQVTKAYGSPLMWLPSLLPEPWNEIVVEYFEQLLQWFYIAVVVFGIAVHQWFCTGEALRSSGELPRGAGFARTGVLAGSFGGLALWCYLTWRGRQEGWGSYEEMSVLFPVGITCGLAAVLVSGWKRGRELLAKKRKFAALGVGMIIGIWLLSPLPGIAEEYGGSIGEVLRMEWDIGLLVLAVVCGAFAVYFLARALYNGWKYRDREEGTVDWGKIVRIGIIVVAVVVGYMIFSVLARGNVKSEYFAEQITVTHVSEESGERAIYCVDFIREELQFYTEDADGNRELHWTKPLTTGALDEFVETCNQEELLGSDEYALFYSPASGWRSPEVYCYVTTYSVKGEREVFSNRHPYLDSELPEKLNQAFYELTGIYCLDTP